MTPKLNGWNNNISPSDGVGGRKPSHETLNSKPMTQLTPQEVEMIEREAGLNATKYAKTDFSDLVEIYTAFCDCYTQTSTKYLLQLKSERERAGKLMEALEEWKQAHENFDSGYKNIDGKATRMDIAALSVECNSADRKLLSEFRKYNKQP